MEQKEFERLAVLEQKQTDSIEAMEKHVVQDAITLGEIRLDIKDIYNKLTTIMIAQTRLETIFWVVGSAIVIITPVITGIVVAYIK